MRKIGVFGGTFNPIHNGHIAMIEYCKKEAELDKVILIPTFTPPHKNSDCLADEHHRLEMCRIAASRLDFAEVSDIEIQRGGKSYTFETLNCLKEIYPTDKLYFIVGADMFLSLEKWKNPEQIFSCADIIAIPRDDENYEELNRHYTQVLKSLGARAIILKNTVLSVSSTYIRENISDSSVVTNLIDKEVYEYIKINRLYGM